MKQFFFLFLLLIGHLLKAQPGDDKHWVYIGLYDQKGISIDSADAHYSIDLVLEKENGAVKYRYRNKKFELKMPWHRELKLTVIERRSGSTMIIHTQGTLDSVAFLQGEFRLNLHEAFLFNVQAVNANIVNKDLSYFSVGKPHQSPVFYNEENDEERHDESQDCYNKAREMELRHGGKNWVRNVCNDEFEEYVHSTVGEVQERINIIETHGNQHRATVYPYKNGSYLRIDFYTDAPYRHTISLSTDGCLSWQTLFRIKGEWYVYLMYFPDSDQVGIDISNSGLVLLSQNGLTNWKFYVSQDWEEDPPKPKNEVLVLKNANWMDDIFAKFYFSD